MDVHRLPTLLLCSLCAGWTCGSAYTDPGELYPSSSIKFGMNGLSCLFWKWTPPSISANCSVQYTAEILKEPRTEMPAGVRDKYPYFTKYFEPRIDLNNNLTLKVQTTCENRTSEVKLFTSPLTTGNSRTMVRNMTCIWHYNEYVNCTWRPGEVVPPNVNYSLRYWFYNSNECPSVGNKQPTPFHDLLDKGEPCQNYTYQSGIPVGCVFKFEQSLKEYKRLVAVVTGGSQDIKPYIYFTCANNIAKLKAPVITDIKIIPNNTLLVRWNESDVPLTVNYQGQLEMSDGHKVIVTVLQGGSMEFPDISPDITYTVKVRVNLMKKAMCFLDPYEQRKDLLWSDWSEEKKIMAIEDKRIRFLVIFLPVVLFITVTTVLLLFYMRRLLFRICPRIPDPSKVLSSDFQHWLKYGKAVYEPKKEEVCVVSLLETSLSSSQVE
ncbi:interleukin-13 receptor subunit alpha-1-like [Eleutherodactylus coqui]|uniref:Type I cytokine receptor cytokine-binding domain-containing protein n=1 Tax=Eleutherodactylus coqui TaxID=57060 RepID=A0A8J6F054_ELECQ|nr:hypothetical protein GDO78_013393 [Eleutherodactylus coqui]